MGVDVVVEFGESSANGSRDIRGADFVSNEYIEADHIRFRLKMTWTEAR